MTCMFSFETASHIGASRSARLSHPAIVHDGEEATREDGPRSLAVGLAARHKAEPQQQRTQPFAQAAARRWWLALAERAEALRLDRRLVDEEVLAAAARRDEAEALLRVEPLDGTLRHGRPVLSARTEGIKTSRASALV